MRTIIYGPPGTGKTTRLLKEIDPMIYYHLTDNTKLS